MQDNAKNILITGKNSYVGESVRDHLISHGYTVTELDMISSEWRNHDFSVYDAVFHVAGIAHDIGGEIKAETYFAVNRDLAIEVAQKAKNEKVKQFVFMSSMSLYEGAKGNITAETAYSPSSPYGKSKLEADVKIRELNSESFKVAVLRPPMIFGKGCKGNFPRLAGLALKTPIFPKIKNQRSMLYIDNLSEFVRLVIKNADSGVFFPQNAEYFSTTDIARIAAEKAGKRLRLTSLFNWAVRLFMPLMRPLRKMFGNLTYDKELSSYLENYCIVDNEESLKRSL